MKMRWSVVRLIMNLFLSSSWSGFVAHATTPHKKVLVGGVWVVKICQFWEWEMMSLSQSSCSICKVVINWQVFSPIKAWIFGHNHVLYYLIIIFFTQFGKNIHKYQQANFWTENRLLRETKRSASGEWWYGRKNIKAPLGKEQWDQKSRIKSIK